MSDILKKLGWKEGMNFRVRAMPDELNDLFISPVENAAEGVEITFVRDSREISDCVEQVLACPTGTRVWLAYPKRSGKIDTDISRDKGWEPLSERNWRPVMQVAINEDWSALRFRREEEFKGKRSVRRGEVSPNEYLDPPHILASELEKNPDAARFYYSLAPSHKKEYNRWIAEAKKEETRMRRLHRTIELLMNKKKTPY